ncbi:DNA polymerase epsilon subunit 2 [Tyrophagus putrescentiae]|nr:DNA polymerase epsilon subunit 2 [Tyrophagus putrescentiae]
MATTGTTTTTKVINTNRSELSRRLALSGLQIRSNALTLFEAELGHGVPPYQSVDDFIGQLTDILLTKISTESMVIGPELATQAVDALREHRRLAVSSSQLADSADRRLGTRTTAKAFAGHYNQLLAALKRLPAIESGQFRLTAIDELNTYDSSVELPCIVYALLRKDPSRISEYLLEDPTGKVPVAFSREATTYREWATFENGIYLVEGVYDAVRDAVLVKSIGLPPPIASMLPESASEEEQQSSNSSRGESMVVVIADIHLDNARTIEALKYLFAGYCKLDQVPEVFVLMGDFTESRVDSFTLKDHMKNLVRLCGSFRRLANQSRFVFVPGPNDLLCEEADQTSHHRESEAPVSHPFTAEHFPTTSTRLAHFYLASNPFHLQLQGRNLTLYSAPLVAHSTRSVIHSPVEEKAKLLSARHCEDYLASYGRLLVSCAHLQAGQSRNYPGPLSLFPRIADCVLLADGGESNHRKGGDTFNQVALYDGALQLATMGSFSRGGGQFAVYYVATNSLEESAVSL